MISAIVITHNEERSIERCLTSIQWADEIVVVDSFSSDRTVELARAFTPNVLQHTYDSDIKQRERGFAASKGDWLLWIDADEEVTEELHTELARIAASVSTHDGYDIPRMAFVLGAWIRHGGWYPDWQFRFARREKLVPEYQEVHGGFRTSGRRARLAGILKHYTYPSVEEMVRKINEHSSLHVSNKLRETRAHGTSLRKILLSPIARFVKMFFLKSGYKDGTQGFLLAAYSAWYTFFLYAKLWEFTSSENVPSGTPPVTNLEIYDRKHNPSVSADFMYDNVSRINHRSHTASDLSPSTSMFLGFVLYPAVKFGLGYFGNARFVKGVRGIVEAALTAFEEFTVQATAWESRTFAQSSR